jgi:hypothetical protein
VRKAGVSLSAYGLGALLHTLPENSVDDWLVRQVTLLGVQFENWMIVTLVLALIAALINVSEKR